MKGVLKAKTSVIFSLSGLVLLGAVAMAAPAMAADADYCRRYAEEAVRANTEAQRLNCRYGGGRWHSDYNGHYNWCRGARKADAVNETLERRKGITGCRSAVNNCTVYAQRAVAQQRENEKRSCGYRGSRWHSDYNGHYNWCWSNANNIRRVQGEDRQRDLALRECRTRGTVGDPCTTYARRAVAQQQENKRLGCGYWGFAWHEDYNGHYKWCQKAQPHEVRGEDQKRVRELNQCRARKR